MTEGTMATLFVRYFFPYQQLFNNIIMFASGSSWLQQIAKPKSFFHNYVIVEEKS